MLDQKDFTVKVVFNNYYTNIYFKEGNNKFLLLGAYLEPILAHFHLRIF